MAGDPQAAAAEAFLSRLTGAPVRSDDILRLSSAQKAAVRAWARNNQIPVDVARLNQAGVTIDSLLGQMSTTLPSPRQTLAAAPALVPVGGLATIGIDIETVATLPDSDDFREHAFYRENFSDAEIAHCILQASPKLSFCGLWAAKEALIKAGAVATSDAGLRDLVIGHDDDGRPSHPGFSLSISHAEQTAVAVALASSGPGPGPSPATSAEDAPAPVGQSGSGAGRWGLALAAGVIAFGLGYLFNALI